jgi:tetratricopeptide (TPR) repeat protein
MKALERDRGRRYATPSELAADIRRYLRHDPVQARPAELSYRSGKYVRRHRISVTVVGILAFVLVTFAAIQSVQLRRITRERDRADRIAEFMTEIFKVSDPGERLGNTVTAREVLDKAAHDIDTGLAKDPELQARMMHVMGRAYLNLGLYPRAQSLFERGIQVSSSANGQQDRETLNTMHDLAWALLQEGRPAEAEALERKLLDTQRRALGPDHPDTVATMGELAFTLCQEGKCDEGVRLNSEVLEKQKRVLGAEAFYTLVTMDNLAIMLDEDGRPAEADKLEQDALAIHLRVFGPENLSTINSMNNLAGFERDLGRDEEAEKLFRRVLDTEERLLGPDQPETAQTKYDLASIFARSGHPDQALSLLRDAVDHGLVPLMDMRIGEDPLFNSLHGDSRFAELVTYSKQHAAARNGK